MIYPCQSIFDITGEKRYKRRIMKPEQCRAARALLGWTQSDLAAAASVGVVTIRQFEGGSTVPRRATIAVIRGALEAAGVSFIEQYGQGIGVHLKAGSR